MISTGELCAACIATSRSQLGLRAECCLVGAQCSSNYQAAELLLSSNFCKVARGEDIQHLRCNQSSKLDGMKQLILGLILLVSAAVCRRRQRRSSSSARTVVP